MPDTQMTLYSFPLSGHAHRIELALTLMGIDYENRVVDIPNGEHRGERYLAINPEGLVPAIVDGDIVITESTAILTYLAARYDGEGRFIPKDPVGAAAVHRYFAQSAGALATGPARARLISVFGAPYDADKTIADAHLYLTQLDRELTGRTFLVRDSLSFADVALYSYVAHAPEGFVSLEEYANIRRWLAAVGAQQGFTPMPATKVTEPADRN
jgi:glutathione S-transferase